MLAQVVVAVVWVGVVAYSVFAGADFGSGFWDLLAGGAEHGASVRHRIDRSLGPVWEANHVWLIFVLVYLWTGFPTVFAAVATTVYVPLLFAGLGIVFRGASFMFRRSSTTVAEARWFGILFAASSVVTPFFLGAAAGAVASGRVPRAGNGRPIGSWVTPTSMLGGALAVVACAWLAAVFLHADSVRDGEEVLAAWFRVRALASGAVVALVGLGGEFLLRSDAPTLAHGRHGRALPVVLGSVAAGVAATALVATGRTEAARVAAGAAVGGIVVAWGVAQYPWMLVDEVTIRQGAANSSTLWGVLIAFGLAAVLVLPALGWLLRLTRHGRLETPTDPSAHAAPDGSSAALLSEWASTPPGPTGTGPSVR